MTCWIVVSARACRVEVHPITCSTFNVSVPCFMHTQIPPYSTHPQQAKYSSKSCLPYCTVLHCTMARWTPALLRILLMSSVSGFISVTTTTTRTNNNIRSNVNILSAQQTHNPEQWAKLLVASTILVSTLTIGSMPPALADEYGVETEAPTLFTGESVMICKKRGPLGACLESVERTAENDNDKASKYFKEPIVKPTIPLLDVGVNKEDDINTNPLILKLKQQTEDNREANEALVKQRTALNDQSASFGPFDRQVIILNTDGTTFTLLENPQAMRLKKAGFIEDRRFVKQPSQQDLEDSKDKTNDGGVFGGLMKGIFGGDSN